MDKNSEHKLLDQFTGLLAQIKMFHWATMSYASHKALDQLHTNLSTLVDHFVECYIGRFKKQPLRTFSVETVASSDASPSKVERYLELERDKLVILRKTLDKTAPELQNILDEMVGDIHQALYLIRLS